MRNLLPFLIISFFISPVFLQGQSYSSELHKRLLETEVEQEVYIHSSHSSSRTGLYYTYANVVKDGIRLKNSSLVGIFNMQGELLHLKSRIPEGNYAAPVAGIDLRQAVESNLPAEITGAEIEIIQKSGNSYEVQIESPQFRHRTGAELVYWSTAEGEIPLVWEFDVDLPDGSHWWQFMINAADGSVVEKFDIQLSCTPMTGHSAGCAHFDAQAITIFDGSGYNVFPFPVESPIHGERALVEEPAFSFASPFGWHDTNGSEGAEFTITRGNNVHAYEDDSDSNFPGFSPDGGPSLDFDFPLNLDASPVTYQSAAITNLFYANNYIHDVLYQYGFTEEAGNFQVNNYGNGGFPDDPVNAEAQDGGGTNNANMATPEDGFSPRMQMYLWNSGGASSNNFLVNPYW
jgi:hypothetical protein